MKKILLKQKVSIVLAAVSIVSLLVTGVLVYFYINKVLTENKKNDIFSLGVQQSKESNLIFTNNQLFAYMLSTRTPVSDYLIKPDAKKGSDLTNLFYEYTNKDKKYLAIYLLDKNGVGQVSTDPRFVGQNYSFRDYFINAIKGIPFIDAAIGKTSNQFGYYFSQPVYDKDKNILGVIVAKVDESDISKSIVSSEVSKDNIIMLVDQFGVILASNDKTRELKSLGTLTEEQKLKIKETNKFLGKEIVPLQYELASQAIKTYSKSVLLNFYDSEDKDNEIVSVNKIGDFSFYLVNEIRLEAIGNQVLSTTSTIVSIVLVILLIITLLIYFSLVNFIKPLDKFKLFFLNISKGDFTQEIDIKTKDEFADMALSMNKMAKDLAGLYKNLDEKVKIKTQKLEESESKLKETLSETEKINKIMIGRELEMIKIKNELKEIKENTAKNN